jgi:uncharacterized protein YndB with AHSA1/START domain
LGRIEKTIEIKAPPEKVWEMLAFDRQLEWDEDNQKNVKNLEYTSEVNTPEDKYRVGASVHVDIKGMGMGEFDYEITESLQNEKITFHVKKSGTNQTAGGMTYILRPIEEGTKFTLVFDYEMPWGVFGTFLEKLFYRRMGEKRQERSLEQLKGILEE